MNKINKIYLIDVNMGYGHQRAAYPLRFFAEEKKVIHANIYSGIPESDKKIWAQSRSFYEFISRFKRIPILGNATFAAFDKFQAISQFYPKRDLSRPNLQLLSTISMIHRKKWGAHLISELNKKPLPMVTTFFVPAFMAEEHNYKEDIYLIVCDADISRAWAPRRTKTSRIKYFAPNKRVVERLKLYGVRDKNIYLTGFPLPNSLVGGENLTKLKKNLGMRFANLDPDGRYRKKYSGVINSMIGSDNMPKNSKRPLTITFAVGGAGAQREIGEKIAKSFKNELVNEKINLNLIAGVHNDVRKYFLDNVKKIGLGAQIGKSINIFSALNKEDYFSGFNEIISKTDILWTKPSELSFYAALGLPIIISDPLGSQEKFNKEWLAIIGAGAEQKDPRYANEWIFEWLAGGVFAALAMHGFQEASKFGSYNIQRVLNHLEFGKQEPVLQY